MDTPVQDAIDEEDRRDEIELMRTKNKEYSSNLTEQLLQKMKVKAHYD